MILTVILIYLLLTLPFFLYSFVQYRKAVRYEKIYLTNWNNEEYEKNAAIQEPVAKLFKAAGARLPQPERMRAFTTSWRLCEYGKAFVYTQTHFKNQMKNSLFWLVFLFERKENKPLKPVLRIILAVVSFLLQNFVVYLLGLLLDTTGIGNTIVSALLGQSESELSSLDHALRHCQAIAKCTLSPAQPFLFLTPLT